MTGDDAICSLSLSLGHQTATSKLIVVFLNVSYFFSQDHPQAVTHIDICNLIQCVAAVLLFPLCSSSRNRIHPLNTVLDLCVCIFECT